MRGEPAMARKSGVFVSYSHKDADWLERFKAVLKPLTRKETIEIWDDTRIAPGADWRMEIDKGLSLARAAVLLVSTNFLNSDFINDVELKQILEKHAKGMGFFWIPITSTLYEETPLEGIQAAWNPKAPIAQLPSPAAQDDALVQVARKLKQAIEANAVASTVELVDAVYPQLTAYAKSPDAEPEVNSYSLTVAQVGATVALKDRGGAVFQEITASDFAKLDPPSQQLIRAHERAMVDLFDRWTELYPRRVAADGAVRDKARADLDALKQDLCKELRSILDFLQRMGLSLQDHYAHIYQICT